MSRHDEAHAACLNILNDNKHSAPRIAELCTFTRQLGGEVDALRAELARVKADSDATITKLLDLYKPGSAPEQHYKTWDDYQREYREWEVDCELYRLACEAAKRDPKP